MLSDHVDIATVSDNKTDHGEQHARSRSQIRQITFTGIPVLLSLVLFTLIATTPATEQPKAAAPQGIAPPEYDEHGDLLRPEGYEKWVVVGTSIGLDYSEGDTRDSDNPGMIHNVYLQPEAFDHFVKTGEFPEQTMFIVTNHRSLPAKTKGEVSRTGYFAAPTAGLEVSIKDSQRYPDGWGFFMYRDSQEQDKTEPQDRQVAKAFPTQNCFECHAEHGAIDNVFTQYYSVLTEAREKYLEKAESP